MAKRAIVMYLEQARIYGEDLSEAKSFSQNQMEKPFCRTTVL